MSNVVEGVTNCEEEDISSSEDGDWTTELNRSGSTREVIEEEEEVERELEQLLSEDNELDLIYYNYSKLLESLSRGYKTSPFSVISNAGGGGSSSRSSSSNDEE